MHGRMRASGPDSETIFVELLDEPVDVWRPVSALIETGSVYRLPATKPEDETWAFAPGALVRCERRSLEGKEQLVAISLA